MSNSVFNERKIIIATKHGKEEVIGPILVSEFGMQPILPGDFDTDQLGTFTGEIERTLDPISAAREKCFRALQASDCDIAVASEGSFGPHPTAYFVNANEEVLVLVDHKNKLEIVARELSIETNFSGAEITNEEELEEFAKQAGFPSHGLILRNSKGDNGLIFKGIQSKQELNHAFHKLMTGYGSVYAETDMRAHMNPSRRIVIEKAAVKLAGKMRHRCPNCGIPGFDVVESKGGLPCENCGAETRALLAYVYECKKCNHREEKLYPLGKKYEDPMYCDFCNP
jgi:hypothetical protein